MAATHLVARSPLGPAIGPGAEPARPVGRFEPNAHCGPFFCSFEGVIDQLTPREPPLIEPEAHAPPPLPPLRPTLALLGRLAARTLAAGVVGLVLLELALRLAGLPEGVGSVRAAYDLDDSTLGVYEAGGRIFVAWPREVAFEANFNSLGCRGPEPQLGDEPPILAIGDSNTFGFGVSDEQTWPAVLERRLREAGTERPVLNFASPRLAIEDEIRYLRRALPALRPDIVILFPSAYNGGAWIDEDGLTPHQRAVEQTRRRRGGSRLRPAIRSLALSEARFVSSHWRQQLVAEGHGEYPPLSRDKPIPSEPEDMGRYERGVAEAKALVESRGAALVLVSMPAMGSRDGMLTLGRSWTEKTARKLGVHYLDLYDAYSQHTDLDALFLLPYDGHPSSLGQEVTADAVLAALRDAELVD